MLGSSTCSPINRERPVCSASSSTGTKPAADTRFRSSNTADPTSNVCDDCTENAFHAPTIETYQSRLSQFRRHFRCSHADHPADCSTDRGLTPGAPSQAATLPLWRPKPSGRWTGISTNVIDSRIRGVLDHGRDPQQVLRYPPVEDPATEVPGQRLVVPGARHVRRLRDHPGERLSRGEELVPCRRRLRPGAPDYHRRRHSLFAEGFR